MNYLDSIKLHHSLVSFSTAKSVFYISLWNGVLRDGIIHDIDIQFFESPSCTIFNDQLILHNHIIPLSTIQLNHLRTILT